MRTPRQPREIGSTVFAAALAAGLWWVDPAAAQCEPGWTSEFGANGLNGPPRSLVWFDDGSGPSLFAAGYFTTAGGTPVRGLARWNGSGWIAIDDGLQADARTLGLLDLGAGPALYAATLGYRVARWDGRTWTQVGGIFQPAGVMGFNSTPPIAFDDGGGPKLYLGSEDVIFHFGASGRLARLDGSTWTTITPDYNTSFIDLAVFDDGTGGRLYAAGYRDNSVAREGFLGRWDGTAWTTIANPPTAPPGYSLPFFGGLSVHSHNGKPALFAGGRFSALGGTPAANIAAWDGTAWAALGEGVGGGDQPWVIGLGVHDDGTGPGLYVGGEFTHAGGGRANNIAKWDGATWSPVGAGVGGWVLAMSSAGPARGLYLGGDFATAGGLPSTCVAHWACSCYPDCDASGALAVADFACFQSQFVLGNMYADCNTDGVLTVAEFGCFQTKFVLGCR